jgi:hypothetical protein
MTFQSPERKGENWTFYEKEELKLSYQTWLLETAKKHGRTPVALEYQLGIKKPTPPPGYDNIIR